MNTKKRRATLLLCSVALAAVATTADARPAHRSNANATAQAGPIVGDNDGRYRFLANQTGANNATHSPRAVRAGRTRRAAQSHAGAAFGGYSGNALVAEARKYLGTNPTGRSRLWCGAFMDMVLRRTGHKGGGNLALGYQNYGQRVSGPVVGAIAVLGRRGGGHVGVVSGVDANGNPIIVSGNHNRTVAESVYPASRVRAYVMPGG